MASHANRLNAEARKLVRKLVAKDASGPAIRRALEQAGHPFDFSGSLLSHYRAHPEIKPRKNAARTKELHVCALVLHGPDGKRVVLTVNEQGEPEWTKQDSGMGAGQASETRSVK